MKKLLALFLALTMLFSMAVFAEDNSAVADENNENQAEEVIRGELPTATVTKLNVTTLPIPLTFALNFEADEADTPQLEEYGNWYADFEFTVNKEVTFNGNGNADGYLAGQYGGWNGRADEEDFGGEMPDDSEWVKVPLTGDVTVLADESIRIMKTAAEEMDQPGLKYTYAQVYEYVQSFNCGVYFDEEFLTANPDVEVTLALKVYNPENEEESYLIGESYDFAIVKTEPEEENEVEIKADAVEDEVVIFDIKTDEVTSETEKVVINTSSVVTDKEVTAVTVPTTAVTDIAANTGLEVKFTNGEENGAQNSVEFDKAALEAVSEAAGNASADNISIVVAKAEDHELEPEQVETKENLNNEVVFSVKVVSQNTGDEITNDGDKLAFGAGKAIVKLYYNKIGNGALVVKWLKDDGTTETIENYTYDETNKILTMELSHFSEYLIYQEAVVSNIPQGGGGGSSTGVTYSVKFEANGGSEVKEQFVKRNDKVEKPEAPVKEGYTFEGWYENAQFSLAYNFDKRVTANLTLYAKWSEGENTETPEKPEEPVETPEADNFKFTDVNASDWYYEAVKFVSEKGIANGISETEFAPNGKVTRGQFIVMLLRAYGIEEMTGDNFDDCGDTWYTGYLAAAKQLGISNGVGDNKFAPEKEISRQEIVTLIYNYLKTIGEVEDAESAASFEDKDEIADWASEAVAFASFKGYVNGKDNNMFDPKGNTKRAELAQILYNMFK